MSHSEKSHDLGAIVAAITLLIGVVTAWLYATGWTYAYWYFDNYQLGLLALDINREAFLFYGFWVVVHQWPWLLGAVVLGFAFTLCRPWRFVALPGFCWAWLSLALVTGIFTLGYVGGRSTSATHFAEDQTSGYQAARRVEIIADAGWLDKRDTQKLAEGLAGGCFRLLLKTKDDVFLIRPVKGLETTRQPLLAIPWSEVEAMRILTDSDSCS